MADDAAAGLDRESMLRRWWSVAGLTLFGATWKLWTLQSEFPQVPLFGWAEWLPSFVDWLAFAILLGSLGATALKPTSRLNWMAFGISLGILVVLDQHRLQPWAWQLLLMATWWSAGSAGQVSNQRCFWLTISIYFWSAVSKLDSDFVSSHGQTLIEALFQSVGINAMNWPASRKSWLAASLPVGELLIAIGLCWRRTRRTALIAATALHVGLILALGPLGLEHRPGVLLWNMAFIGHVWLLFGQRVCGASRQTRSASEGMGSSASITRSLALRACQFAIPVVCIWPATERWGLCDRWLAWSVYAAHSERVSVTLTGEGLRRLPASARRCVTNGDLPLDRWSLAALDVPIYPQLRFQFGVVEWLRRRCGDENLVEVIVQHSRGVAGDIERLTVEQCADRRRDFWINAQPRDASPAGNRQ